MWSPVAIGVGKALFRSLPARELFGRLQCRDGPRQREAQHLQVQLTHGVRLRTGERPSKQS